MRCFEPDVMGIEINCIERSGVEGKIISGKRSGGEGKIRTAKSEIAHDFGSMVLPKAAALNSVVF